MFNVTVESHSSNISTLRLADVLSEIVILIFEMTSFICLELLCALFSFRRGHDDLGDHYLDCGDLSNALKCYSRARDYCTSAKHVINMCLNVIKVQQPGNIQHAAAVILVTWQYLLERKIL